jgi:hypothetical protein
MIQTSIARKKKIQERQNQHVQQARDKIPDPTNNEKSLSNAGAGPISES